MTATIYDGNGYEITGGLQPSSVSDQAINVAQRLAAERGEPVYLADDDGGWEVAPSGEVSESAWLQKAMDEENDDAEGGGQ